MPHCFCVTAKATHLLNCFSLNCKVASGRQLNEAFKQFCALTRCFWAWRPRRARGTESGAHCYTSHRKSWQVRTNTQGRSGCESSPRLECALQKSKWTRLKIPWVALFVATHKFRIQGFGTHLKTVSTVKSFPAITGSGCHWAWHSPSGRCFSTALWNSRRLTVAYSSAFWCLFLFFFLFFCARFADPFRNSAETTDTSLDCRCTLDLLLHVDLLASSLRFDLPSPASPAPGGCQRWLKGLPGGFKGPFNPSSRS